MRGHPTSRHRLSGTIHLIPLDNLTLGKCLQFPKNFARELECSQSTRGHDARIPSRERVDVPVGARIVAGMLTEVFPPIAGVFPAAEETRARQGDSRRTDPSDG